MFRFVKRLLHKIFKIKKKETVLEHMLKTPGFRVTLPGDYDGDPLILKNNLEEIKNGQ